MGGRTDGRANGWVKSRTDGHTVGVRDYKTKQNVYKQNAKDGEERERADNWSIKRSKKRRRKKEIIQN